MAHEVVYVGAPKECQVCGKDFGDLMYDARIIGGSWGNICEECFGEYGCGLGTGRGQEYARQSDGRWLKVRG